MKSIALTLLILIIFGLALFIPAKDTDAQITLPVSVYLITGSIDAATSRTGDNVTAIMSDANKIWDQADIAFDIRSIEKVGFGHLQRSMNARIRTLIEDGHHAADSINVYFFSEIGGPNGLTFPGNILAIMDTPSVLEHRVTSHEIGHVLGLRHVAPRNRLMASGVNGFDLSESEIATARQHAMMLSKEFNS